MSNGKYAFFIDIDGTLLYKGKISDKDKAAIKTARESGHKIFINTARGYSIMPKEILSLQTDGIIAAIGCTVIMDGKCVLSEGFPIEDFADDFDYFTFVDRRSVAIEGERERLCNDCFSENDGIIIKDGKELKQRENGGGAYKICLGGVLKDADRERLAKKYQFYQHPTYAEFTKKGFTKALGIDFVLKKCGIDRAHSVAIGDSANDLEMLSAAGISVAMGNALQSVKDACDMVTSCVWDGGVADAINKIIFNL